MQYITIRFDQGKPINIEKTESTRERMSGLFGKTLDSDNKGLWISPCSSVHSFGMKYAIDLIYLDKLYRVVKVVEKFTPSKMSMSINAKSVVELYAGAVEYYGIQAGMQMTFEQA